MRRYNELLVLIFAACWLGCSKSEPTSPGGPVSAKSIDRLLVFVRDWPNEHVEIDFERHAEGSTLIMYIPPQPASGGQPAQPRILLDSVGPNTEDPQEIVELLHTFNVWAMADSNAVGAACSTRGGQWSCNPTVNDYSLVMQVIRHGDTRAQRYTRLGERPSTRARALGDFVLAWKHRVQAGAGTKRGVRRSRP